MVVIRLSRGGSKRTPKYRITVADKRRSRDGRRIEVLGQYIPTPRGSEKRLVLDVEKAESWIQKGAQPSPRVQKLIEMAKAGA